jgi:hypothetical protein
MYVMSVLQTLFGLTMAPPRSRYGYTLWPGCCTGVSGPGAIPASPQNTHQSLYVLTIYQPSLPLQDHHHSSAAVERVPREFFVDQRVQNQVIIVRNCHCTWPINRRPRYACQLALPHKQ